MKSCVWQWRWRLKASPEKLWPVVSDTDRFNRFVGLPPVAFKSARVASARVLGMEIRWDEHPFEFEVPRRFSVVRRYHDGPFLELRSSLELQPVADGTDLIYGVSIAPRNSFGRFVAWLQVGIIARWKFGRTFRAIDRAVRSNAPAYAESPALGESFRRTIDKALGDLQRKELLVDHLLTAAAPDLVQMRPFRLARLWRVPRDVVLSLFLHATKRGVLDAAWTIICPACRGQQSEAEKLRDLRFDVHCGSCNVGFTADFDRLTELTFRLARRWKDIKMPSYCVGGPGRTPHIAAQFRLSPGGRFSGTLSLAEGTYRVRSPVSSGSSRLRVGGTGDGSASIHMTPSAMEPAELNVASPCAFELGGDLPEETFVAIERTEWLDDSCSAAYVATFQDFRDLFDTDVLAPGTAVKVENVTLLFTDLKDSTAMYGRAGDAKAFGLVRNHFGLLTDVVREHGGAVVKTIGDAVMAAFLDPALALKAAVAMHASVSALRAPDGRPVVLKVGLHAGPCFAVTLNDSLDYFGSTVNLAARIQHQAEGGDVVLDSELAEALEAKRLFAGLAQNEFEAELKGIAGRRKLLRILVASG